MKFAQGFYPLPDQEKKYEPSIGNYYFPGEHGPQRFLEHYAQGFYAKNKQKKESEQGNDQNTKLKK